MKNKQTAVDWFYQRILAKDIKEVYKQAKQIEKEQIKEAYKVVDLDIQHEDVGEINSEQYYKETYE